jgi:hypothetical protein
MNIDLKAPRSYSEMTEKQIRFVASLMLFGMEEESIWVRSFIRFTALKQKGLKDDRYYFKVKGSKPVVSLSFDEINSFSKTLKFITGCYLGINPVRIRGFEAMDSRWENMTFLQYLEAENFYQAYVHTKDEQFLNKLIATLYLKKGKKFDNNDTEKRAKRLSRCNKVTKMCVMMWAMGVKEFLTHKFPELFAQVLNAPSVDGAPDMYVIIQNQIRMLTDGDITKREKVLEALAWDALDELNAQVKEARTIKPV